MAGPNDHIRLGLSAEDFRNYLLESGFVTHYDLSVRPGVVCDLMEQDAVWEAYIEDRAEAARERLGKPKETQK